jgi:hypothetical protein
MNQLVEEIIKPILENNSKIKKIVGIYGGRFQPFGPHHYKTYKWLQSKVDEAYITTSNIKKPPRHPMNFKEKVRHMTKMGVKAKYIIEEKTPYVAKNLEKKYNKDTTAFVYVFGAKDAGRLSSGKYYRDFLKNKNNLEGYTKHGYFLVAPHVSISVGGKEVSGTTMRELLGSDKYDDKKRAKLFKNMFGYYNKGVFQMMTNKFKKLFEESEMEFKPKSMYYVPSKKKPLKKKWKDGEGKELLKDLQLPIKVGDTIMMGRFKNKKVKIKSIDFNDKGDLTINGRPALKFRIVKSKEIDEFLTHVNINKIIKEVTTTSLSGKQGVDSGPNMFMGGEKVYVSRGKRQAERLGWEVIDYILNVNSDSAPPSKYEMLDGWPMGPHRSVSYLPAGKGTGVTPNSQENLTGNKGYDKWVRAIRSVAQEVGFEMIKFTEKDKKIRKQIAKDSTSVIKKQKEEEVNERGFSKSWWKDLLTEGGAYGHMAHPFDDNELTFGDLKKIITNGLGGNLSREDNVTEKLDGQNIMISWKDGKLIAARNKGHIKNGGKNALTKGGIKSKFKGRGDIANAFNFAMDDLEKAIKALSDKQKEKIFNNGYNFMNLEVMWPQSANVIDYDKAELVFHGALKYNDSGTVKGEVKGSGRMLAGMIKQRNKNIGKKYKIGKPVFLDVPKHQDFGAKKDKFIGKLNKLKNTYALKDADTLALYHQSYWEEYIYNGAQQFGYDIPNKILKNLTKRWAFFDKSYKIPTIKSDLKEQPKFLEWVLSTDKNNHAKMVKENMKPFETLFFEVGAEILKNVKGFMAANPDKSVQGIRKKLKTAIAGVKAGGDKKKLNTLKLQLDKLNKIGGVDAIVPSEGIVFKYKGKTYKFTGAFAPINQITGLINF